jgi:hypothetical protein
MNLSLLDGGLDHPETTHESHHLTTDEEPSQLSGVDTAGGGYEVLCVLEDSRGPIASLGDGGGWRMPARGCE